MKLVKTTACLLLLISACKHEDIQQVPVLASTQTEAHCDTLSQISFAVSVWPVIKTKCVTCHDSTGSIKLYDYAHIRDFAVSGQLYGVLNGNPDLIQMPPYVKLDSCAVYKIDKWIKEGNLNN